MMDAESRARAARGYALRATDQIDAIVEGNQQAELLESAIHSLNRAADPLCRLRAPHRVLR